MNSELRKKLTRVHEILQDTSSAYRSLIEDFVAIFKEMSQVEASTDAQRESNDYPATLSRGSIVKIQGLLDRIQGINNANIATLQQLRRDIELVIPKIYDREPQAAANLDVDRINATFKSVFEDWADFEKDMNNRLKRRSNEFQEERDKCGEDSLKVRVIFATSSSFLILLTF